MSNDIEMSEIDEEGKSPVDQLFELAACRGDERLPLLEPENITKAARVSIRDPGMYTKLISKIAGWHSLSNFKQLVRKRVSEAAAKRKKREAQEAAEKRLAEAEELGKPFIAMGKPIQVAEDFNAQCKPNLIYYDETWLDHDLNAYRVAEFQEIRTDLQEWMASGVDADTGEPIHPNKHDLDNVMDALKGVEFRSKLATEPPTWLDHWEDVDPDPKMVIAASNGLLELENNSLMPLTPRFFTRNGLTYPYDPDAPAPDLWLSFLEDLWPGKEGKVNHRALQEIMGHLLTGETKYQKIFLLIGPGRCGKGTIARVATALIGKANVHSQPVTKLGQDFGLKALLGKQLMIVPDMRLGRNANIGGITEALLNISGEDDVSIGRKHQDDVQAKLNTRLLLLSNKELALPDQSGALHMRFIPLVMHTSFADRQDPTLTGRLCEELPSILNWALDGLRRLEARKDEKGRQLGFVITPDGKSMLNTIHQQGSPVQAFLGECCISERGETIAKDDLYEAFEGWCDESDLDNHYSKATFSKALSTASGYNVGATRARTDDGREQRYSGVTLKSEYIGRWSDDEL